MTCRWCEDYSRNHSTLEMQVGGSQSPAIIASSSARMMDIYLDRKSLVAELCTLQHRQDEVGDTTAQLDHLAVIFRAKATKSCFKVKRTRGQLPEWAHTRVYVNFIRSCSPKAPIQPSGCSQLAGVHCPHITTLVTCPHLTSSI